LTADIAHHSTAWCAAILDCLQLGRCSPVKQFSRVSERFHQWFGRHVCLLHWSRSWTWWRSPRIQRVCFQLWEGGTVTASVFFCV